MHKNEFIVGTALKLFVKSYINKIHNKTLRVVTFCIINPVLLFYVLFIIKNIKEVIFDSMLVKPTFSYTQLYTIYITACYSMVTNWNLSNYFVVRHSAKIIIPSLGYRLDCFNIRAHYTLVFVHAKRNLHYRCDHIYGTHAFVTKSKIYLCYSFYIFWAS